MRPHILLLTTGGTIASLPTAEGLAPGLDGEALAGLLPQGIMDCYDITIRDILHLDSSVGTDAERCPSSLSVSIPRS